MANGKCRPRKYVLRSNNVQLVTSVNRFTLLTLHGRSGFRQLYVCRSARSLVSRYAQSFRSADSSSCLSEGVPLSQFSTSSLVKAMRTTLLKCLVQSLSPFLLNSPEAGSFCLTHINHEILILHDIASCPLPSLVPIMA